MFLRPLAASVAAAVLLALAPAASAAPVNLIQNGSFEDPDLSMFDVSNANPGAFCRDGFARTGLCSVTMFTNTDPRDNFSAVQSFATQPIMLSPGMYRLQAWALITSSESAEIVARNFPDTATGLRLFAGDANLSVSPGNSVSFEFVYPNDYPFSDTVAPIPALDEQSFVFVRTDWFRLSTRFTITDPTPIRISVIATNDTRRGGSVPSPTLLHLVDDMSLTAVPLPAAGWALLAGLGGLGAAGLRRRRAARS